MVWILILLSSLRNFLHWLSVTLCLMLMHLVLYIFSSRLICFDVSLHPMCEHYEIFFPSKYIILRPGSNIALKSVLKLVSSLKRDVLHNVFFLIYWLFISFVSSHMNKKHAFTFVEVMIALAVFAIGILAVLRLVTQNLVTMDTTQMRTTATFLAKEWIELVYNMRDSNIAKWLPRDCILQPHFPTEFWWLLPNPEDACAWRFSDWSDVVLQISFDSGAYISSMTWSPGTTLIDRWNKNRLYYATWELWWQRMFWYSSRPIPGQRPTAFARYIVFTGVREWMDTIPRDSILKIESHVLFNKWTKPSEVVLESFIGNYK